MEGLAYIHKHGILHRDIKPENLVFEENGYLRITDFGIARKWSPENGKETSGTPGYMAPEVMCRNNHNIQVDYFALGVICFECMKGRRPYVGRSRKEIRDQILAKQVRLRKDDVSKGWSLEAADFINGLIQRKPNKRLGANGPDELKNHPWMKDYPWGKLTRKEIVPPFKPNVSLKSNLRSETSLSTQSTLLRRTLTQASTRRVPQYSENRQCKVSKSTNFRTFRELLL